MRRSDRSMLSQRESTGRKEGEPEAEMRMRAVRIVAPRRAETLQVPLPRPGPNEVRVRLEGGGKDVVSAAPGDRVAFLSGHAYAEYDIAQGSEIVTAPPGTAIFPGEALGCAVNAFRRSGIRAGETVAVVGVGFIGAVIAELA